MRLTFRWVEEDAPGAHWLDLYERAWPSYREWFLREGDQARPGLRACRAQLRRHMPELVPLWEHLVELSGGGNLAARMLSLYRPTPFLAGCSQAVWTRGAPRLIRNYDYHPAACEGVFVLGRWTGTRVLAASDCLWGALDGMNEHGLTVALAFGGSPDVGDGFGIPLILRYVLEFSRTVDEATEVLQRVPSHMAYNVSLLDASGAYAVVHVAPDRPAVVRHRAVATNHQLHPHTTWTQYERLTSSEERERVLLSALDEPNLTADAFVARFLEPPLYSRRYDKGFGTLYTSVYHPAELRAEYLWPHGRVEQSLTDFRETELVVPFAAPAHPPV